jgi:hypothetical protein
MGFLLSLAGCIYLAYWFGKRKYTLRRYEIRDEKRRLQFKEYMARYIDSAHEKEVLDKFSRLSIEEKYALLEPDLIEMFGQNYKEKFPLIQKLPIKQKDRYSRAVYKWSPNPNLFHAMELLMSREGKIMFIDFTGFHVMLAQGKETDLAVYQQIERNMRRLGHDFTLVDKMSYTELMDPRYCKSTTVGYTELVPDYMAITQERHRWWDD